MIIESILFNKLENKKVKCNVCNHRCKIAENKQGFCLTRNNLNGKLYSCNYALISSQAIDPIEKKPLYHFLPGSLTYSLGGFGCNMRCLNCQNYIISQNIDKHNESIEILPEKVVKNAINANCQSIAWTYNEPTMYLEYVLETALISHENGLKNIYVSNGYMSDESLNLLLPQIDAFNIDLKSMSNEFYINNCNATLEPILNNLKNIYEHKNHLEITNLLIGGYNDSYELIKSLTDFIADELGKDVPLHFSRFFPYYKMSHVPPTEISKLEIAKEIAIESGLNNIYLGNVPFKQNTKCPNCGELLIERDGYNIKNMNMITGGKCGICHKELNFVE